MLIIITTTKDETEHLHDKTHLNSLPETDVFVLRCYDFLWFIADVLSSIICSKQRMKWIQVDCIFIGAAENNKIAEIFFENIFTNLQLLLIYICNICGIGNIFWKRELKCDLLQWNIIWLFVVILVFKKMCCFFNQGRDNFSFCKWVCIKYF